MATHNGEVWLKEQIDSIHNQLYVDITLFISDDVSGETEYYAFTNLVSTYKNIKVISHDKKFGSAGKNFYHLIVNVNIENFDYVAFADQDDIWNPNKLISHITLAEENNADGVSSNVIAFWPNGEKKLIVKSQAQKKWDFLFESAGPGCTFLMTPWLVGKVREQLSNPLSPAREVVLHDWLSYAVCRAHGRKWVIDPTPSLLYRQHDNNVVGANVGLKAKFARFKKLKQGWYRSEVTKISETCALISDEIELKKINTLLNHKNLKSQLHLLAYIPQARRKLTDRLVLLGLVLSFLF